MFQIINAKYLTSSVNTEGMLKGGVAEIAIAGRSNVGKSSFINYLTNNSKLCRTSGDPGRTRMINYFEINNGKFYFVDLPGYGYAKAAHNEINKWADFINIYLTDNAALKNVFVLIDIRHIPSVLDVQLINYLNTNNLPFTIIATKADKITRSQIRSQINMIAEHLKIGVDNIYVVSAVNKTGKDEILKRVDQIINK